MGQGAQLADFGILAHAILSAQTLAQANSLTFRIVYTAFRKESPALFPNPLAT